MIYLSHKPAPPLDRAVEAIWLYNGYQPPHRLERVLPAGTTGWIINLREDRFRCYHPETFCPIADLSGTLVAGPRSRVQVIDTEQQTAIMGVHFRPGGLRFLTKIPVYEFTERDVPLENIGGRLTADIRGRLIAAATPREKIRTLERLLAARFCPERRPHRAVAEALRRFALGDEPLCQTDLAADLGLSCRRFIEVFTASVGLTPKVYARICRFQKALRKIHGAKHSDWADLAFECGWYDQAHMIRDFKQFSGLTPSEYLRLHGKFMLHVPVEEWGQIYPIPAGKELVGSP